MTEFVEVPEPGAPYGVKGIGELGTVVATPGGRRRAPAGDRQALNRIPVSPDELLGLRAAGLVGRAPRRSPTSRRSSPFPSTSASDSGSRS